MTEQKLHIVLISEAHCTNSNSVKLRRCCTYLTNHPDDVAPAGTAITVRNSIKRHLLPEYKTNHIQATTIPVEEKGGNFFSFLRCRFTVGRDWNAKHERYGSRLTNTITLLQYLA